MKSKDKTIEQTVIHKAEIIPNIKSSNPAERLKAVRIAKQKGTLSKKTRVLKAIGADEWSNLAAFINGEGAKRYIEEVSSLEGEAFLRGFSAIVEYFKAKQVRSEGNVTNIQINNITFE